MTFGDLPLIQSQSRSNRRFSDLRHLTESNENETIWIRGRLHSSRIKGKIAFLVIRQGISSIQVVICEGDGVTHDMITFAHSIPKESVVDINGVVKKSPNAIDGATHKHLELAIRELWVVSRSAALPFEVTDAEIPQPLISLQKQEFRAINAKMEELRQNPVENAKKIEELTARKATTNKYVIVSQKTRLDNRIIDLRTTTNQAIFRLQSAVCGLFRQFLLQREFVEIHSPKIISTASEGGAEVFTLAYFQSKAYLAQSPQLYKQMAVNADMYRVFEVAPVFRAENSQTNRHLTEYIGLDLETTFNFHYHEVVSLIVELFVFIFEGLKNSCRAEIETVKKQFPFEDLVVTDKVPHLTYREGTELLREEGEDISEFGDISTAQEKKLGAIVKKKYGSDFFLLDKYPSSFRPFYTMNDPEDTRLTNSYDFFIRGQEVLSGAQRIHDPALLQEKAREKGVQLVKPYLEAFQYGSFPHAGGGIGLERFLKQYLGLKNIRKTSMFPRDPTRLTP